MTLITNDSGRSATAQEISAAAKVAIVVFDIVGCAASYHLAKAGWSVVLFERKKRTSGTTWHASGLVSETHGVPVMPTLAVMGPRSRDFLTVRLARICMWGTARCGHSAAPLSANWIGSCTYTWNSSVCGGRNHHG